MGDQDENTKIGYIYKLTCAESSDVYYGSTKRKLNERKARHKHAYKRYLNGSNVYYTSFEIIKYASCQISLVETVKYKNKLELSQCERSYIQNNKCINKNIPSRTKQEWYTDNNQKIKEYSQNYYIQNKESILNNLKQIENCPCGCEFMKANKSNHNKTKRHKEYIKSIQ